MGVLDQDTTLTPDLDVSLAMGIIITKEKHTQDHIILILDLVGQLVN